MNFDLIEDYVKRLTKRDIESFALKQNISLDNNEIDFIYDYIKREYKAIIFDNPKNVLLKIKGKVRPNTYNKIVSLYEKYEEKLELLAKTIREST